MRLMVFCTTILLTWGTAGSTHVAKADLQPHETGVMVDAGYGAGSSFFFGSATAGSDLTFNGQTIFGNQPAPTDLQSSFFGSATISSSAPLAAVINTQQRGNVGLLPVGAMELRDASFGAYSQIAFTVVDQSAGTGPVNLMVNIKQDLLLSSPISGDIKNQGSSVLGTNVQLFELDGDTRAPSPMDSFTGSANVSSDGIVMPISGFVGNLTVLDAGSTATQKHQEVDVNYTIDTMVIPGNSYVLTASHFGAVGVDGTGFNPGNGSYWGVQSGNTLDVTMASSNSNVRFQAINAIPEPSQLICLTLAGLLGGAWQAGKWRRQQSSPGGLASGTSARHQA